MPGSIQVTVLDFKELPSSSNSVKISLGKIEYQVEEYGTFSFPLTNLRDNLIITIQDSEGNQVAHSGVRTMSILEKGVWDDVFPIEGGGLIHMKLEFILSDEGRNRIRSVRESAMKKKQAEILGSRLRNDDNAKSLALSLHKHEVSDVLRATSSQDFRRSSSNDDTSLKSSESFDVINDETFKRQSFTDATGKKEEIPSSRMMEEIEQDPNGSGNLVDKLYVHNLENKIPSDAKKTHEESTSNKNNEFPTFSQGTEGNKTKTNEIQLQEIDLQRRLKDSSSSDMVSSRLTIAEKIKSFTPKLADEMDKQASMEKTPQNINKMINVFESTLSKDRVPIKPPSTKSNIFGTSRLLKVNTVKDFYEKPESNLKNSETSSSTRLRNSFSTGDLRKTLSSIITKDQVESDEHFVESAEIDIQSKGNDPKCTEKMPKEAEGDKTMSLLSCSKTEEKCHQEKGEEIESSESADIDASKGSFGQAMKIALVVGFGVVVLLFRPREAGKGNKENTRAPRNIVPMNKRGSIDEQRRRIGVSRLS